MGDARTEAIAAGNAALKDKYGYEPASGRPEDAYWVHALDAVPAGVLARLAIERGGMEQAGYRWREPLFGSWVVHHWAPDGEPSEPVYRLAALTEEADPRAE